MPEKHVNIVISEAIMKRVRRQVADLKRDVARLDADIDLIVTKDDLAALRKADEEYRSGKTVRFVKH